jgi:uncharacterized protein (TIGR04255 family)
MRGIHMFQMDFSKVQIGKIFMELRYKDVFSFPEQRYKILDKLSKKYPEVNAEFNERVSLFNPEKRISIHISMNHIIIDWDKPPNLNEFLKVARSIIDDVKRILKIEVIFRIGIRNFIQHQVSKPEEATKYIMSRYFSANANKTSDIADEIYTTAVSLSGRKKNVKFNLNVNYQQNQVIQGSLNQILAETVSHFIIADVDVFKDTNVNLGNLEGFFRDVQEFNDQRVIAYLKGVEGASYVTQN